MNLRSSKEWASDGPFSLRQALIRRFEAPFRAPEDGRAVMSLEALEAVTEAAVLIAFAELNGEPRVILTARREDLEHHPGQVSFPGGRVDPEDRDPIHTALREAEEEIGLPAQGVHVLGQMPPFFIPTGYRVIPVVAWVEELPILTPDPSEVASIFTLPAHQALNPDTWQERTLERLGKPHRYVEMNFEGRRIWGATAGMLRELALALATP